MSAPSTQTPQPAAPGDLPLPPELLAQGFQDEQDVKERSRAYRSKNAEFEQAYRANLLEKLR